ncbi:pirin family protein [Agromyces intestinalis]|uniref:Pirin family protein n=1 Tax=Agromyces intestinalis TaxID=2592652 RepID=A0A5C1YHN6_9MICO|nr:pirin family protein [Agromyces intestinalis]QEO15085.1 pirin family protein [Agromyces intestinalis]
MSNLERDPVELLCPPEQPTAPLVRVLTPRDVPLGGPRAMAVRRTLPQRGRTTIGAWCFADHYGPDDVAQTGGMVVPPHPHTGLQTVSWLFEGEIEHRDSTGVHAYVRPGEVNLMTAGRGISHSEVSTAATSTLHGVQLWVALPDTARRALPFFEHAETVPVEVDDAIVRVFVGSLPYVEPEASVTVFSPLVGAQIELPAGGEAWIDLDESFEHGILVDRGPVRVTVRALEGEADDAPDDADPLAETGHTATLEWSELGFVPAGHDGVRLRATADAPVRVVLLGGAPFGEELVMWWNFIGRSHDEIAEARARWQADVISGGEPDGPFGTVAGYDGEPLPAPELPTVRLRPRS